MTILIIFAITFTVLFSGRFLLRMKTLKLHSEYTVKQIKEDVQSVMIPWFVCTNPLIRAF